jgi:hypothetical protein
LILGDVFAFALARMLYRGHGLLSSSSSSYDMYQGVGPLGAAVGSLVFALCTLGATAFSLAVVWLTLGAGTFSVAVVWLTLGAATPVCGSIVAVTRCV